ncbi:hypothetical protein [Halorientalis halophila]|uniref:hypothetical protein n=1 Tax=Halorientalis halophila TaxID=3108499 RepID=UPI00300B39CC
MTGYYDYVLGIIPVSVAGISAALVAAGLGLTTAVPVASLFALALVGHAMFVNAPVDDATPGSQGSHAQDSPQFSAD